MTTGKAGTLDDLVGEFLTSEFEDSPTLATSVGADGYDHLLGDYSGEAFAARVSGPSTTRLPDPESCRSDSRNARCSSARPM